MISHAMSCPDRLDRVPIIRQLHVALGHHILAMMCHYRCLMGEACARGCKGPVQGRVTLDVQCFQRRAPRLSLRRQKRAPRLHDARHRSHRCMGNSRRRPNSWSYHFAAAVGSFVDCGRWPLAQHPRFLALASARDLEEGVHQILGLRPSHVSTISTAEARLTRSPAPEWHYRATASRPMRSFCG
jgi:hypothetical protein